MDRLTLPLDRARSALLGVAMRVRPIAPLVARRDARVVARSIAGIALAFVGSVVIPGALVVLTPLVLGVAHVGADIRYLVRREAGDRRAEALLYGGCALLLALRAVEMAAPQVLPGAGLGFARVELATAAGWILGAAMLGACDAGSRLRATGIGLLAGGLLALAWPRPELARIVFAHVHNVVAVVLWVTLFFRGRRATLVPLALIGVALVVILRGGTLEYVVRFGGHDTLGADVFGAAALLAPGVGGALGPALVLSYVFLQGIHYMVWLVWVPDSLRPGQGTPTFRMSARAAVRDFGGVGLGVLVLAAVAVIAAAAFGPLRVRAAYLSLAAFHGYLELAAAAYLATRMARRRAPSTAAA